ncbi:hypothetical protein ACFSCX_19420 [Bacillus salitolerans]|uniref:Uncharacterized protein n=1 Tax=Bacillus salitolerans TaxID=1437434 RepID=A0ABW4LUF0_9BACI
MTPHANQDSPIDKGNKRFVVKYGDDWKTIYNSLSELVKGCSADTWEESVIRLRNHFSWEYEGIR